MTTIDERVAAGAAWLDVNRPGWWQRIDLDTLDLRDPCQCVLGQEWGDFVFAPHEIRGAWGEVAIAHGLECDVKAPYKDLTAAWRTLIQARRDAEAPAVWPGRTHDGQRMRDTDTADVDRGVL